MKKILALETSTAHASVAVCIGSQVLATETSTSQRTHSEFINPAIERCLSKSNLKLEEIDAFSVGKGPGSFTGLRVSGNIAKTFAMTFQKPLVAVDSLTLLKEEVRRLDISSPRILCLLNAHKNMNYTALFMDEEFEIPPCALTIQDLNEREFQSETPILCVGEGFKAYEKFWSEKFLNQIFRLPDLSDYPLASTLALITEKKLAQNQTIEWNSFEPLYIRASEAEENQRVKSR